MRAGTTSIILSFLMVVTLFSHIATPPVELSEEIGKMDTPIGSETTISVTTHPMGSSNALALEVPPSDAVTGLNLSLRPHILPRDDSIAWTTISDWNRTGITADGVDYNGTDGLKVRSLDLSWDFEYSSSSAFTASGWTMGTGWLWGYDSCLGSSGGVHGGSKAIYTYNCNYPNGIPSSGYFATSPVIDCSGCSGSWQLQYWKRLGIEYHYYDDAQVHVKNQQGSWVTVWDHNGGSTNPSSWTRMTHDISQYVSGNSNLQVRFKLGRTDGSVTYTGWNVDDVQFIPLGNGMPEQANWTSAKFGPFATGPFQSLPEPYGLMSIDATIPTGSSLEWTILDGQTDIPIPGYVDRDGASVDLGLIDSEKHPSLRIRLEFDKPAGINSPIVHGVYLQGRYVQSFNRDPGWSGTINWDGDSFPGVGYTSSPLFESAKPISRIRTSITSAGSGTWQMKLDDNAWELAPQNTWRTLSDYAHKVQFRWSSNSASDDLRSVDIRIDSGGMPTNPAIDIGLDGIKEWQINSSSIGHWGWQNRLSTGGYSHDFIWTTPATKQVGVWLPKDGVDSLSFALSPHESGVTNLSSSLNVDGTSIATRSIGTTGTVQQLVLTPSEIDSLNSNLSNSQTVWPPQGEQVGVEYVLAIFDVTADFGGVQLGGLAAMHHPWANLSYGASDEMVMAINDQLPNAPQASGSKLVPITVQMSLPGNMLGTITDLESFSGLTTDTLTYENLTATLTPSRHWVVLNTTHTALEGVVEGVQLDVIGQRHQIKMLCLPDGTLIPAAGATVDPDELSMIHWDGSSGCQMDINGTAIENSLRFRLNASWDDEDSLALKVRLVLKDGRRSVPRVISLGLGALMGVENDVEITSWKILNDLGVEIPDNRLYLKSSSPINVEVNLGFVEVWAPYAPRAGDVAVRLWQDDVIVVNSTALVNGSINLQYTTPLSSQPVEYRVDLYSLHGQENITTINTSKTYQIDSYAPLVINQTVRKYDHLEPSLNQDITVEIFDRPLLPDALSLMLWRDWADDANGDGYVNDTEYVAYPMNVPSNTSRTHGNYSFSLDDTDGPAGGVVTGYVSGSDAAGNEVVRGGGPRIGEHLFSYQLASDGAPWIIGQGGFSDGPHSWLHPATNYEIVIPFDEPNGLSDLANVTFQLASNSIVDPLQVFWNASSNRCLSSGQYLIVQSCHIHSRSGEMNPFTSALELRMEFTLEWDLPLENDLRRAPALTVQDRSGQVAWLELPQLRWRFSPALAITPESVTLDVDGGAIIDRSAWVQPGTLLNISGQVQFMETGMTPTMPFNVSILLDGQRTVIATTNGYFLAQLNAPQESKSHSLSFGLTGLPPDAVDQTDSATTQFWIEVDDIHPEPAGLDSPRDDVEIPISDLSSLQIDLRLNETGKLDQDTLQLYFKVTKSSQPSGPALIEGSAPLTITGSPSGRSIPATATIDVASRLPEDAYQDSLILSIWVKGHDMAGNEMASTALYNSGSTPFVSWNIEHLMAQIELTKVSYSRSGELDIGQTTMVTVELRNSGHAPGEARILLYELGRDGENRSLTPVAISVVVPMGERVTYDIDWIPEEKGERWVLVTLAGGGSIEGEHLNIRGVGGDDSLTNALSGVPMAWLALIAVLVLILSLVVGVAMRTGGSGESSLDGTDDYWDDDEWEDEEEEYSTYASPSQAMAAIAPAQPPQPPAGYAQAVPPAGMQQQQPQMQQQQQMQAPAGGYQQAYVQPPQQTMQPAQAGKPDQWDEAQWRAYQLQYDQYYQSQGRPPNQ